MGLINIENNRYIRILMDRSDITIDGINIAYLVYKNEEERDKDKARLNEINDLMTIIQLKRSQVDPEGSDEVWAPYQAIDYMIVNQELVFYKYEGLEEHIVPEEIVIEAEKLGFKREWVEDKIVLIHSIKHHVKEYEQDPFTAEHFYNILKNHYSMEDIVIDTDDVKNKENKE